MSAQTRGNINAWAPRMTPRCKSVSLGHNHRTRNPHYRRCFLFSRLTHISPTSHHALKFQGHTAPVSSCAQAHANCRRSPLESQQPTPKGNVARRNTNIVGANIHLLTTCWMCLKHRQLPKGPRATAQRSERIDDWEKERNAVNT